MINIARNILPILSPLPAALILILAGLLFSIFKRRRISIGLTALGLAFLTVSGYGLFTRNALYSLERRHPPFELEAISPEIQRKLRHVVILGSGHVTDPDLPSTAQIGGSSLFRLVEGIRIGRQLPAAKLVISGGRIPSDPVPNAQIVWNVAKTIGIANRSLIVEDRPQDTYDEAETLKPVLGTEPFVLVTSAAHMERALKIFEEMGMHPLPGPTDYVIKNVQGASYWSWLPTCANISMTERVIYEWLGELWTHLKKKSKNFQS